MFHDVLESLFVFNYCYVFRPFIYAYNVLTFSHFIVSFCTGFTNSKHQYVNITRIILFSTYLFIVLHLIDLWFSFLLINTPLTFYAFNEIKQFNTVFIWTCCCWFFFFFLHILLFFLVSVEFLGRLRSTPLFFIFYFSVCYIIYYVLYEFFWASF